MSVEIAVVVGKDGLPLHWHVPTRPSVARIEDARDLWTVIWENRDNLAGVAHSHPGSGLPGPSYEDVTTFSAIESALGRRLDWWIISTDRVIVARWHGPDPLKYRGREIDPASEPCRWLSNLRTLSYR